MGKPIKRRASARDITERVLWLNQRSADWAFLNLIDVVNCLPTLTNAQRASLDSLMRKQGVVLDFRSNFAKLKDVSKIVCQNYSADRQGEPRPFALTPKDEAFLLKQMRAFLRAFKEFKSEGP